MSHPPERLLAELARVLSAVDAEAAVHVEFCPACAVRFAAVLSLLGDAKGRRGRPVFAASRPRRRGARASPAARPIHPAEGSLLAFTRTLLELNEKVFEHVRFCTPCMWQVVQALPAQRSAPPVGAPAPREDDEDASLLAELAALQGAEREARLLAEGRFHRPSLAGSLRREARRHLAQEAAKRTLEIAAAGGHSILLIGPPGAGKTLMGRCLPGLLPPLAPGEAEEVESMLRVARTIADLAGGGPIRPAALAEAVQYSHGRTIWTAN